MRINIEIIGLPALSQAVGKRKAGVNLPGRNVTVQRVIDQLIRQFGPAVKNAIYDPEGDVDPTVQIALNGKQFIGPDRLDTSLKEGDTLTFMLLMAGGAGQAEGSDPSFQIDHVSPAEAHGIKELE